MLYMVGTERETDALESKLPKRVFHELVHSIAILDREYGENRDYREHGGYSLVVETAEDVERMRAYIDFDVHPCEWAVKIGPDSGYLCALYLMNDDYSVMAYMPLSVAPDAILQDLED